LRLLPRRALVAIGLAISFVVAAASPASAWSYTYPPSTRVHAGVSVWTPRTLDFNSGWDDVNNNAWLVFGFQWDQPQHRQEIVPGTTIEIGAQIDCAWAQMQFSVQQTQPNYQGYRAAGFDTNISNASHALPYEDTMFGDHCVNNPNSGQGWFGVGVLNPQNLPSGHYYIRVAIDSRPGATNPHYQSPVALRTHTGVQYPSAYTNILPYSSTQCAWNDQTIDAYWGNYGWNGINLRMQASWCSWTDWDHIIIPFDGSLYTGVYRGSIWPDTLNDQGFESAGLGAYGKCCDNANTTKYCNDPFPAFDGNCFLEWNQGSSPSVPSITQDRPIPRTPDLTYTTEAAVRCRKGAWQTCDLQIGFWSLPSGQARMTGYTITDDGHWYICRQDSDHGQGASPIAPGDTTMRWAVVNWSHANMDVDYSFLGGKTFHANPDNGQVGVGNSSTGPGCTKM
jgi:hypothetical protein